MEQLLSFHCSFLIDYIIFGISPKKPVLVFLSFFFPQKKFCSLSVMILNDYTRHMLLIHKRCGSKRGLHLCRFQFLKTNGVGGYVKWHFSAAKLFLTHISNAPSWLLNWPVNFLIRTQKLDRECFWLSRMWRVLWECWIHWGPCSTEVD